MNATDRARLDLEPVPVDEAGVPAMSKVIVGPSGWRTAWTIGRRVEPYGPVYADVKLAIAASRHVNERGAS